MNLKNGLAVVTGGAAGIGRTIAYSLLKRGTKVFLTDVDEKTGEKTREELAKEFGEKSVHFSVCDVRKSDQIDESFQMAKSCLGGLNIVVNNAGITSENPKTIDASNIIAINITSTVAGTRLGLKYLSKKNGGSGGAIVNLSSITGLYHPWPAMAVYCSTKSFIQRFSVCMGDRVYSEPSGVRVFSVCPGLTETAMGNGLMDQLEGLPELQERLQKDLDDHPMQSVEVCGEGTAKVIEQAISGTTWVIELDRNPQQVHMKLVKRNCFLH